MLKQDAIDHFGSVAKLAKALDLNVQAIYMWGEIVPERNAYKLQVITDGTLTVDPAVYAKPKNQSLETG
jgi:transcriptional repressor of cell division inhibition gene dicB